MKKLMLGFGAAVLLAGCVSSEVAFLPSSAPVPPQGYTVIGEPVSGTCSYNFLLWFGGSVLESQQFAAFQDAMSGAKGADALVNMTIDKHVYSPIGLHFIWSVEAIRITGTPVKFNK